mgnify:CR=1 FL=1
MFDAIAERYDVLNSVLTLGFDARWRMRAVQSLRLTGTETVLDLCTGTADVSVALARRTPGAARVIGLDFSTEMLRKGIQKCNAMDLSRRVHLLRADATQVPLPANSVDAVTVAFGIRNVEDMDGALQEIYRVTRPGARVAILEFGMPRIPGVRDCYAFYFRRVLPFIGRIVSGHDSAYTYLPASVTDFPSGARFCRRLESVGFCEVKATSLHFGILYLYEAVRS